MDSYEQRGIAERASDPSVDGGRPQPGIVPENNSSQSKSVEATVSRKALVAAEPSVDSAGESAAIESSGQARVVRDARILRRARLASRSGLVRLRTAPRRAANTSSLVLDCCITIGAVALAVLARKALTPVMGTAHPFVTLYIVVLLAAWLGGLVPALVAMVLGALAGMYFVPTTYERAMGAGVFCIVSAVAIAFAEAHRRALRRAEDANEAIQLHREELEREVAERRAVERSLRSAEDRFRRLSDSNIIGIIHVDAEGRIVHANDAFIRMLGYERDDFERLRPAWTDLSAPESAEADDAAMQQLRDVGTCKPYEKLYVHRDGTTRVTAMVGGARFNPPHPGGIAFVLNLSELSRARQTLQMQSRVLESMAEGVVVTTVGGVIAFTNASLDHMFGYERGELTGARISALLTLSDADRKDLVEEITMALRIRGHWTGELENRRKDGSTFTAEGTVAAMSGPHESQQYWICVQQDITQRKAAEAAVHEAEERLGLAMEAAQLGTWEYDPREHRLRPSSMMRRLINDAGPDEPAHETWVDMDSVYATMHPDDAPRVRQAIADALVGTRDYRIEFRAVRPDGDIRWFAAFGKVFRDAHGQPLRMTGLTLDVTDRRAAEESLRQSEERFRLAAKAVASLIYDWDLTTGHVLRSPGLKAMCGYEPLEVSPLESWWPQQVHPDDYAATRERFNEAIAEGKDGYRIEYRVRHRDGHWVHVWDRCLFVRDQSGKPIRVVGSALDVTELRRAEQELQKAKETAEAADRAKDHFLAVLSHELRTPLTPVLGAVQLLAVDPSIPQHVRDDLEMVRRNVELEARLIDDLLDLTRVARGKIDLQIQPCDAQLAVRRAAEICQAELHDRQLRLVLDLSAPRSTVAADPARLQQIVWNLLKNSIKFSRPGSEIRVISACDEAGRFVVRVVDEGIGIAPDAIGRIFDAFEQAHQDMTRRFGGLGLGLAISKALTDLHGGQLEAHSDGVERGATFTLRLPLVESAAAAASVAPPDSAMPTSEQAEQSLRILLVEDHQDTAAALARLLRMFRHQVSVAGTVADAMDLAMTEPFDLIISDIGLPDGTGHDLMRQLTERERHIKGIALTGYGMESDVERSREAGFLDHLMKPVDLNRLQHVIQKVASDELV